jgi:Tfp pilus assembly protein PilW
VSRARAGDGFTLVELLIASLVSLLVFGATLTVLESMMRQFRLADDQAEVETRARQGADRLARQLRNLASPADIVTDIAASTQPKSVDRNLASDLIFKDVGDTRAAGSLNSANVRRVRYCLQNSGPVAGTDFSASPARGVLWMQTQTWDTASAPLLPAGTDCPAAGWTAQRIVADHVVNPATTPLFRYSGDTGVVAGTSAAEREQISRVAVTLIVDADTTRAPSATQLTTAVVLRNQNRVPVASFIYTLQNPVTCAVQLNGSASQDPESKPLTYEWYVDGTKRAETGVVVQLTVTKGTHTYQLKVKDPAQLAGASSVETRTC